MHEAGERHGTTRRGGETMKKAAAILFFLGLFQSAGAVAPPTDQALLETVARRTFDYFWEKANPLNGLIPDATTNPSCSITSVGFGLASLCIADQRGWISHQEAYTRVHTTLRSFLDYPGNPSVTLVQSEHGHPYHWVDIKTGKWTGVEGVFASDTAILMAGVLTAGQYFHGTEVEKLANQIYENVDWAWFYNPASQTSYVGYTPAAGLFGAYSATEIGGLFLLLGIASPTHPLPAEAWQQLGNSYFHAEYAGHAYVGDGAAYTHQWPFCFLDPRGKKDYFLNYADNLREAALAGRQWCLDHATEGYGKKLWGLTPCLGPDRYGEYAAPVIPGALVPYNGRDNDGTVAPTAALGFLPFVPEESLEFMRSLYSDHGGAAFGKYGFTDSVNLKKNFWSAAYLGIDQGPIVIMLDNYQNGTVWKAFNRHPAIRQALDKVGFTGEIDSFEHPPRVFSGAQWSCAPRQGRLVWDNQHAKGGSRSLRVYLAGRRTRLSFQARPVWNDFSEYTSLGFWAIGEGAWEVALRDQPGRRVVLTPASVLTEGEWTLHYFSLSNTARESVQAVEFTYFSLPNEARKHVYLDEVHLTRSPVWEAPPAPASFTAWPGKHRGEVNLAWKLSPAGSGQGVVAAYRVKISDQPIRDFRDFSSSREALADYRPSLGYGEQKLTVPNLEAGRPYYFAIAEQNHIYAFSRPLGAQSPASAAPDQPWALPPGELSEFDLASWETFASRQVKLQVRKAPGLSGEALELSGMVPPSEDPSWFGIRKAVPGRVSPGTRISLQVKNGRLPLTLEFKLVDSSGAVFGKKIPLKIQENEWQKISFAMNELQYWWGGAGSRVLAFADALELAFTLQPSGQAASGQVRVNGLKIE